MKSNIAATAILSGDLEITLDSLDPERLKLHLHSARRKLQKNNLTKKIKLTKHQNDIALALGFSDGFGAYRADHKSKIDEFLQSNGMKRRSDLITPRRLRNPEWNKAEDSNKKVYYGTRFAQSRQDLSERLFYSELPMPTKVFTGYDFNYWGYWEDGSEVLDLLTLDFMGGITDSRLASFLGGTEAIATNVELAYKLGNEVVFTGHPDHPTRNIIDVVLGGYLIYFRHHMHMLGDVLVSRSSETCNGRVCHDLAIEDPDDLFNKTYLPIIQLFRHRINTQPNGWVEILPYNDSLVFLRGSKGQYDFVFRNQRDAIFDTQVYGKNTPARHVPTAVPDYAFEHWHHFKHKGWKAMDRVLAERARIADPNRREWNEPERSLLIDHYLSTGEFQVKVFDAPQKLDGFARIDVGEYDLAVSELVSIKEFVQWAAGLADNSLPERDDRLSTVNSDGDNTLPAASTLRSALRYIRDMEEKTGVPLRLMKEHEYRAFRKTAIPAKPEITDDKLLEFVSPDGNVFDRHPPHMLETDFQALAFRFKRKPEWIQHSCGLRAVNSDEIAELLCEGTTILSQSLTDYSFRTAGMPLCPVAEGSTGKYKGLRFVFRICHELHKQ